MSATLGSLDQGLLHVLGRKHSIAVLDWLQSHPGGSSQKEIDYGVVKSHPSTKSTMTCLEEAGLALRDSNKRYFLSEKGQAALAMTRGAFVRPALTHEVRPKQ